MAFIGLHDLLLGAAVAHILMTAVMALFARHKVQYLSLSWVMGIFSCAIFFALRYVPIIEQAHPGILHPAMLMGLLATVFLQSIYPLSISMPAFLQWGRMWRYAAPAILLIGVYLMALMVGVHPTLFHSWAEVQGQLFNSDFVLRVAMLLLSVYYIVNIFRLPRTLLAMPDIHGYVIGYTIALGFSWILYVWVSLNFSIVVFEVWVLVFTGLNMYLCLRVLETIALGMPHPSIKKVEKAPSAEEIEQAQADFNEANRQRFERIEFWMQNHPDYWKKFTFGRDQLCEQVGLNRHLLLQALRSQDFNDVHEYISTYRVDELEKLILRGQITALRECEDAGFATIKTARSTFERIKGVSLDDFFALHAVPTRL